MTEIGFENDIARISTDKNVLVLRWADAPRGVGELREFEKIGRKLTSEYGKKALLASVIVSGTPKFSQEARDEVTRLTRTPMFHLGTAQIILVGGLAGVAVRAFLSTSVLVARPSTPTKVFAQLDPGIDWILARLHEGPVSWTRGDLSAFLNRAVS
jgi:hypothetical protein